MGRRGTIVYVGEVRAYGWEVMCMVVCRGLVGMSVVVAWEL